MIDPQATELIKQYQSLADSLAWQAWRGASYAWELDDLRAIASLGLVEAAARWRPYCQGAGFDPDKVEYFRAYMIRRVHGALIDAMRSQDWGFTRGRHARSRALTQAGSGQGATETQLAQRTGMSIPQIRGTLRDLATRQVSLEAGQHDPASAQDVESTVQTRAILRAAVTAIRELDAAQQAVIALHYYQGLQLQQVAVVMGITKPVASALHAQAVLAVREAMAAAAETGTG